MATLVQPIGNVGWDTAVVVPNDPEYEDKRSAIQRLRYRALRTIYHLRDGVVNLNNRPFVLPKDITASVENDEGQSIHDETPDTTNPVVQYGGQDEVADASITTESAVVVDNQGPRTATINTPWLPPRLMFYGTEEFDNDHRTIIDTEAKFRNHFLPALHHIGHSTADSPSLGLDGEGSNKYGRNGDLTILQISIFALNHTYLLHVKKLGGGAHMFDLTDTAGQSLRSVLSSNQHPQLWWDVRQDQDILWNNFAIRLGWVTDLQLVELCLRWRDRKYLNDLKSCIHSYWDKLMTGQEFYLWIDNNVKANQIRKYDDGFNVLLRDEIPTAMWEYAAADVAFLGEIWKLMHPKMTPKMKKLVRIHTDLRLEACAELLPMQEGNLAPTDFSVLRVGASRREIVSRTLRGLLYW